MAMSVTLTDIKSETSVHGTDKNTLLLSCFLIEI